MSEIKTFRSILSPWAIKPNFLALFSRGAGAYPVIDGLRSISYLLVLAFHTSLIFGFKAGEAFGQELLNQTPFLFNWIWNGDKAVDLFFVLSGFLIAIILFKELEKTGSIRLSRFYYRRYLRLTPLYFLLIFLYWWLGLNNHETLWANLLYVNNYITDDEMAMPWTWSLAVEEQFYLLLPLLILITLRINRHAFLRLMIGLLLFSLVARFLVLYFNEVLWQADYRDMLLSSDFSSQFYDQLYHSLLTRYGPFVAGILAAYLFFYERIRLGVWLVEHPNKGFLLDSLALTTVLFFMFFPIVDLRFQETSPGLIAYVVCHRVLFSVGVAWLIVSMVLGRHSFPWLQALLSWRFWMPFSQLTYSMYLIHFFAVFSTLHGYKQYYESFNWPAWKFAAVTISVSFSVSLLLALVAGVLCWLLIEKPFLNFRDATYREVFTAQIDRAKTLVRAR